MSDFWTNFHGSKSSLVSMISIRQLLRKYWKLINGHDRSHCIYRSKPAAREFMTIFCMLYN